MKQFYLRLLMAAACLLITSNILAHDFVVDGIYYNILSAKDKTVEVTFRDNNQFGSDYTGNTTIPNWITYNHTTYYVTGIGDYAFYGCSGLKSIEIPNSVTSIGYAAFNGCKSLISITIPNSVTSIGESAFWGCSGLTKITVPYSVTSIGNRTFSGCVGLTSITIPNSVTSIGESAFYGCKGLTSVVIPNSVTSIGRDAFFNTAWYKSQPDGVVYAGKVLYNYKGTIPDGTSIDIKQGTVSISDYAFTQNSTGLKSITVPSSVMQIGYGAFWGCTGLTSITMHSGMTNIGTRAFCNCSGLTSIKLPGSITTIGNEAFNGCTSLTELYINDGKKTLSLGYGNIDTNPKALFFECPLETLYLGRNLLYDKSNSPFYQISTLKTVTISDYVTTISDYAFQGCTNLTDINLPESVTTIGNYSFGGCTNLANINIPESVTSIGYATFNGTEWLNNREFPNGLVYIGKILYKYNGVMPQNTSIDIEEGTVSIAGGAFYGYTRLTNINIPNSITSIGHSAFSGCKGLTSIEIPNSVTSIENSAFNGCSGLTSIEFPDSVTTIGDYAFSGCTGLTSIEIPNSVTSIGFSAFSSCSGLTSITIPNNVTSIKNGAFGYCSNLRDITIPESVTSLGTGTFGYCTSLESIELPNSVTTIPQKLFYGCSELTNVKIGNSVNEIDNSAFNGCKKLLMIIPKSVKEIGRDAFSGCAQAKLVILHKIQSIEDTGIMPRSAHIYVPTETLKEHYAAYSDSVKYIFTEEVTPTATTLFLKITNNIPEIIESENIAIDNYDNVTDELTLTGLDPDTEYSFTYYVTTEEAGRIEKQVSARTESLTFKTLKAKATSNTRAVICAEANIANEETGTGFEWRRIDAPDLVPSEFAGCAVHEGVMEGALHNLSANTYYKYRPYYCSAAGNHYYGDWIGFGTADAYVYFTPTVHTYASAKRGVNSVCLNGYALAGSDDIREQGFEYWPVGTVQAAPSRNGDARNGASRVTASGQRMSIVIEDLEYGTVYACRAYVVTDSETFYGEEITFETSFPTGIADVYEKENEPSIQVQGNTIVVSGHKPGDRVLVYTMHGAVIYNGTADEEITLESGMYIVNIGNTTKKVRIR